MATLVLDARSIVESLSSVGVDITVDDIIHPVVSCAVLMVPLFEAPTASEALIA